MSEVKNKIIAVIGPTASGKTALAVRLAQALNTEIISCDSMQLYRGMEIGTAAPTPTEMGGIVHHLIGICSPDACYSCADYAQAATSIANELIARGKTPLFCGGTGLYLTSVISGTHFDETAGSTALRSALLTEYAEKGIDGIYERLRSVDPESAAAIHPNNTKRVIRALEVYLSTGKTKTQWDQESQAVPDKYHAVLIGLYDSDRTRSAERIERRVDAMFAAGLENEVRTLLQNGYLLPGTTAAQAIGYKELCGAISGAYSMDEARQKIVIATRQYAKRQMTYFRRMKAVHWLDCGALDREALFQQALQLAQAN